MAGGGVGADGAGVLGAGVLGAGVLGVVGAGGAWVSCGLVAAACVVPPDSSGKPAMIATVLGATGKTGSVVAQRLRAGGAEVRAFARSADKLESLTKLGCDRFDLYQLHGVTDLDVLEERTAAAGVILRARDEGLCRFVGITGQWLSWNITLADARAGAGKSLNLGGGGIMVVLSVLLFFLSMIVGPRLRRR